MIDWSRISKMIALVTSPNNGEATAAIAATERALKASGATWADLVAKVAETTPQATTTSPKHRPGQVADIWEGLEIVAGAPSKLTAWETEFVTDFIERGREPSVKQAAIIARIFAKYHIVVVYDEPPF